MDNRVLTNNELEQRERLQARIANRLPLTSEDFRDAGAPMLNEYESEHLYPAGQDLWERSGS